MSKDSKIEFQNSEERLIMDSILDSIWSIDTNYKLKTFNDFFKKRNLKSTGFKAKKGALIKNINPEHFETYWKPKYDKVFLGESMVFEYLSPDKKYFEIKLYPNFKDDQIIGLTAIGIDLTELKYAQNLLQKSEERFRLFTTFGYEGIAIHQDGKIIDVNKRFTKMLNYSLDELKEMSLKDLVHPDDFKIARDNIDNDFTEPYELRLIRKGGEIFYANVKGSRIIYKGAKARVASFYDISNIKNAELALVETYNIVSTSPLVIFHWVNDSSWKTTFVTENVHELLGYRANDFLSGKVSYKDIIHPEDFDRVTEEMLSYSKSKMDEVFMQEYRVIIKDGTIKWIRDFPSVRRDNNNNITHFNGVIHNITKQKKTKENLISSERFLMQTQKVANIGTYSYDINKLTWESSEIHDSIFGINKSYIKDHDGWFNLIHPEDRKKVGEYFENKELLSQAYYEKEYRIIRIDNQEVRWVRDRGEVVKGNDDVPIKVIGTIQDITPQKEAEFILRESEKKYSQLLGNIPNVSWSTNANGHTSFISNNVKQVYGFASQEIYDAGTDLWFKRIHLEDVDKVSTAFKNFCEGKTKSYNVEYRIKHKNGHWIWLQDQANVREEIDGIMQVYGAFLDITNKKEIEIALEESEIKFKAIVRDQTEMIVRWKPGGIRTFVNQAYCKIFKVKPEEVLGTSFFSVVPKKDLLPLKNRLNSITPDNPISTATELIQLSDGSFGWQEWTDRGFFDKKGKIIDYQSIGRDVNERKEANDKIKRSEKNYRSIFNNVNDAIAIHEINSTSFLDVNARFGEITGYTVEELKRFTVEDISVNEPPYTIGNLIKSMKKTAAGEPQTFEWITKNKDKSRTHVEVSLRKITLEGIPRIAAIVRDITERKKAELVLQNAFAEVSKLKKQLERENIYLKEEISLSFNYEDMVYASVEISDVLTLVEQVSITNATVLILGETGTGKELIARAIHNTSDRKDSSFIRINCAAIPSELIESELFGHIKGSFTGAIKDRIGKFELANGGTLFLDEIGEMPLQLQPKLLRAIQEGEIEPVGSSEIRKLDVRIVAATNKDLKEEAENKRFREDLYFRLNVFPITIPPLRERVEDIPVLIDHFVNKYCKKYGKNIKYISDVTLQQMKSYAWPGNVRELENLVERACIISNEEILEFREFESSVENVPIKQMSSTLDDVQRNHIIKILNQTQWKIDGKEGAAIILDVKPSTLRDRMKKLGIKRSTP